MIIHKLQILFLLAICTQSCSKVQDIDPFLLRQFEKNACKKYDGEGRIPIKLIITYYTLKSDDDTLSKRTEEFAYNKNGLIKEKVDVRNNIENRIIYHYKNDLLTSKDHFYNNEKMSTEKFSYDQNIINSITYNAQGDTIKKNHLRFYPSQRSFIHICEILNQVTNQFKLKFNDSIVYNSNEQMTFRSYTYLKKKTKYAILSGVSTLKLAYTYNNHNLLENEVSSYEGENVSYAYLSTTYTYNDKKKMTHVVQRKARKNQIIKDKNITYNKKGEIMTIHTLKGDQEAIHEKYEYINGKVSRIISTNSFDKETFTITEYDYQY